MANQIQMAHSADVMGAAMIAGGLYGCCRAASKSGLIHSWCKPWGNGEANLLKLLEIWVFSVASVIMLGGAARPERFVSRSPRVTARDRRHFAPRVKQTPIERQPTAAASSERRPAHWPVTGVCCLARLTASWTIAASSVHQA